MSHDEARRLVTAFCGRILRWKPSEPRQFSRNGSLETGAGLTAVPEALISSKEHHEKRVPKLFVPPGHYYSPITNPNEAGDYVANLYSRPIPNELPGIAIDRADMVATWQRLVPLLTEVPFPNTIRAGYRYAFENDFYSWGDGSMLSAIIRAHRPKRIIEIGSGWSSACTLDTIDGYLDGNCTLTCIEPNPQTLVELIGSAPSSKVRIIETIVQKVPLETFDQLIANDILFIDSSHVLRTGSDVCFELFEILPRLTSGVLVHIHDIYWPFEYPHRWVSEDNRSWNESYAVRAFLTNNPAWKIVMLNDYLARFERELIESTFPVFLNNSGASLWLRKL